MQGYQKTQEKVLPKKEKPDTLSICTIIFFLFDPIKPEEFNDPFECASGMSTNASRVNSNMILKACSIISILCSCKKLS